MKAAKDQLERVLPKALHAIRSLLCTATNQTPHERMFSFPRRAISGMAMPSWLLDQNTTVLLRRFVRTKKEPICDPVHLLDANPTYAKVRHADGRESTVSTSDLAPFPNLSCNRSPDATVNTPAETSFNKDCEATVPPATSNSLVPDASEVTSDDKLPIAKEAQKVELRRSRRQRRPPERWGYH